MADSRAQLTIREHPRDSAGFTYVYPVVSRRAGGVSIGINLNTNDACNWRCIYCQVPGLQRGSAPPVDLALLEDELRRFLEEAIHGDFLARRVPPSARRLNDIALSGNGEPTSAREFAAVIEVIGRVIVDFDLDGKIKLVLITNGSLVHHRRVQDGLTKMAKLNGEIWFKLDRATAAGIKAVNSTRTSMEKVLQNLRTASRLCPTWLQTCLFALDGNPPAEEELYAYLDCLTTLKRGGVPLRGVLLYGVARPSYQPEAARISSLTEVWLDGFAERIRATGFPVTVSP